MSAENLADPDLDGQALSSMVPVDTPIWAYLQWALQAHGSPPAFHLACALAVGVHELARRGFRLKLHHKPMAAWFTLVGDSAAGKSTAIGMAESFIRDVWAEAELPMADPWVEIDGSIAGILYSLAEHYNSSRGTTVALAYHHEISATFNTRESISEMLCRIADGNTYSRHLRELQKKAGSYDKIVRPQVSALFAATEAALQPHFDESKRAGGIFSRMWWIKPTLSEKSLRFEAEESESVEALRERALDSWIGWFATLDALEDKTLRMSALGEKALREGLWAQAQEGFEEGDEANAVRLRAVDKARVFSALWAAQRGSTVVSAADVEAASAWCRLLLHHNSRMRTLGIPAIMRQVERAQRVIDRSGDEGVVRRTLYQKLRTDKRTLDVVLETLLDSGTVVSTHTETGAVRYLSCETRAAKQILTLPGAQVIDITSKREK